MEAPLSSNLQSSKVVNHLDGGFQKKWPNGRGLGVASPLRLRHCNRLGHRVYDGLGTGQWCHWEANRHGHEGPSRGMAILVMRAGRGLLPECGSTLLAVSGCSMGSQHQPFKRLALELASRSMRFRPSGSVTGVVACRVDPVATVLSDPLAGMRD